MNKNFLALGLAAALLEPQVAGAEGFAINEWSAEGVAMGGARMFAEDDAANVAYNPASITKVKGEVMKSSYTYLSPHGNYKLYDGAGKEFADGKNVVHAGWNGSVSALSRALPWYTNLKEKAMHLLMHFSLS